MFDIELELARVKRDLHAAEQYAAGLSDRLTLSERDAEALRDENAALRTRLAAVAPPSAPSEEQRAPTGFGVDATAASSLNGHASIESVIRDTVNSALSMMTQEDSDFVYDERSGFYYSARYNYYYDPVSRRGGANFSEWEGLMLVEGRG